MRILLILLILIWSLFLRAEEVYLPVGESKIFYPSSEAKVHVSNGKTLKVFDYESHIKVLAKKPGQSQLNFDDKNITIYVLNKNRIQFFNQTKSLIKNLRGLKVNIIEDAINVSGELLRLSDWQNIAELAKQYNENYIFKANMDSSLKNKAISKITQIIQSKNLPFPEFKWTPHMRVIINESLKTHDDFWSEVFSPLGIEITYSKTKIHLEPLVRVNVQIAEMSKNWNRSLGINWDINLQSQLLSPFESSGNILASLKVIENRGLGKILAQPSLLCRSGSNADFHSGGEFPIRIISFAAKNIIWKKHGVLLNIKPKADYSGNLSIEIEAEVSIIDTSQTVDGVPGMKTNKISTHFDLTEKRTIALSGLIKNDWGKSLEGLPYLSQIPILGKLFSSESYMQNKTEMVIFVTPEIVKPSIQNKKNLMPKGWDNEFSI